MKENLDFLKKYNEIEILNMTNNEYKHDKINAPFIIST